MPNRFVPDNWILTDKLRQYAKDRKLTDANIDEQYDLFIVCQFKTDILNWDKCWMMWILRGIKRGWIPTIQEMKYTNTIATDVDSAVENRKFNEQIARFKK